ncbi:MAG: hypothetical protein ACFFD4_38665 [Candidatus Odinarchaeota archaeon]
MTDSIEIKNIEYKILLAIVKLREEQILTTVTAISNALGISTSTGSVKTQRLEALGLLSREELGQGTVNNLEDKGVEELEKWQGQKSATFLEDLEKQLYSSINTMKKEALLKELKPVADETLLKKISYYYDKDLYRTARKIAADEMIKTQKDLYDFLKKTGEVGNYDEMRIKSLFHMIEAINALNSPKE